MGKSVSVNLDSNTRLYPDVDAGDFSKTQDQDLEKSDYDNITFIQYNFSWVSFDETNRDPGNELVIKHKLDHWPFTF